MNTFLNRVKRAATKFVLPIVGLLVASQGYAQVESVPGPQIWQVIERDNVLWITADTPLTPRSLEWDSSRIEEIISQSQELILPPSVVPSQPGFLKKIGMQKRRVKLKMLPDGQTLNDLLPAPLYAEFMEAKAQYAPEAENIEQLRPMYAAIELFHMALEKEGMVFNPKFQMDIIETARQNDLLITDTRTEYPAEKMLDTLENDVPMEHEITCIEGVMFSIENEAALRRESAEAWAIGDLDALGNATFTRPKARCIREANSFDQGFVSANQKVREQRLESVITALENNNSSIALVNIGEMIGPDGLASDLRSMGYQIIEL